MLVEDEGKGEEPEVCAKGQMEFEWACTWVGDGRKPALAEDNAQGLLSEVFWSSQAYPSLILFWYFVLSVLPPF